MLQNLTGVHLVVILGIVLLLFGAPKLPALAKSLGQSMRILKTEVSAVADDGNTPVDTGNGAESAAISTTSNVATTDATPAPGTIAGDANLR